MDVKKSKSLLIAGGVLVLVALIYFLGLKSSGTQISTPSSYEPGTRVVTFTKIPPNFPSEVILENKALNESITVTTKEGDTQMKVSYKSDSSVSDLLTLYTDTLTAKGWQVSTEVATDKVGVLDVTKGGKEITIIITAIGQVGGVEEIGSLVTFQYQK